MGQSFVKVLGSCTHVEDQKELLGYYTSSQQMEDLSLYHYAC